MYLFTTVTHTESRSFFPLPRLNVVRQRKKMCLLIISSLVIHYNSISPYIFSFLFSYCTEGDLNYVITFEQANKHTLKYKVTVQVDEHSLTKARRISQKFAASQLRQRAHVRLEPFCRVRLVRTRRRMV